MTVLPSHAIVTIAIAVISLAGGMSARAEPSAYGCSGLDTVSGLPSVEGKNGVFYRVLADLRMRHPMEDAVMVQMAALSEALAARGTTLIYVTVPTKSQAMPQFLPPVAADYAYDRDTATLVYGDIIQRLGRYGVLAPDILEALSQAAPDQPPFFQADFHWTSEGARLAAEAVGELVQAQPFYADLTLGEFTTAELAPMAAFSTMRRTLQAYCIDELPRVEARAHLTERVLAPQAGEEDIFAGGDEPVQIVLVGTSFSDSPLGNFAGYLSQYSGLDVVNYAVTGGNQFGAMTSYLTSRDFADNPPRFVVWENPIYSNLAQFGPDPLDELITAAGATCSLTLPTTPSGSNGLTADLKGITVGPNDVILADLGTDGPREAVFSLTTGSGIVRTAVMQRSDRMLASGRFSTRFETVMLHADQIGPLSLLANEAITNALKYVGKPDAGPASIDIALTWDADSIHFSVSNTLGSGLRGGGEAPESTKLGMVLISAFADQLAANVQSGPVAADHKFHLWVKFRPNGLAMVGNPVRDAAGTA